MGRKRRRRKKKNAPVAQPGQAGPGARPLSRRRRWIYRIIAMTLVPLLLLGLLEGALWLFGCGYDTSYWVKSGDGKSLLSNPQFGWRFFGRELSREPIPTIILPEKPAGTYRIFVFGGSAARGVPVAMLSFARILETMLNDRYQGARFEVINTGMVAINSHAVLPIVRDCSGLGGDIYVVYMGNNEVVGPYGPGTVVTGFTPSLGLIRASLAVRATKLGQLLGDLAGLWPGRPKAWRGMEMFIENRVAADDPRLDPVYANFRTNLSDICEEARNAGAPVVLSTLVTNLKDIPPFASVHRAGLADGQKTEWEKLYQDGAELQEAGQNEKAIDKYEAAAKIDNKFAELHYRIGRCRLALEQYELARESFVEARDLDALRFRADTRINQIIREVAKEQGARLADAEAFAAAGGPAKIAGEELLYEHVHLTFEGSHAVASAVFERVSELLPAAVRKSAGQKTEPPSLARCEELMLHTAPVRYSAAMSMGQLTKRPPFTKEWHKAALAKWQRIGAAATPAETRRTVDVYRRAVERRPRDILIRRTLGKMLASIGDRNGAIEQFEKALGFYPHWHEVRVDLANTLALAGRYKEALRQARTVLATRPTDHNARLVLGLTLLKMDRPENAAAELRKVVALRPDDAAAQANLGEALLKMKRWAEAEPHFAAAAEIDPDNAAYHHRLGLARLEQGKTQEAFEALQRAVRLGPNQPLCHYHLAVAAYRLQKTGLARLHFRRAVSLDPRIAEQDRELRGAFGRN